MIESEPQFIVLLDMTHCSPGTWSAGEAFRLVCGHITRYEKDIFVLALLRDETAGAHWQPQTTIRARGGNYALTHHADLFRDAAAVIAEKRGFSIDDVMNSPRDYCFENEAILDEHFDKGMTYGDVVNEDKSIYKTAGSEAEELHGVSLAEVLSNPDKYERFDAPSEQFKMYCIAEGCDALVFIDSEDALCKLHDEEKLRTCGVSDCFASTVMSGETYVETGRAYCVAHDYETITGKISEKLGATDYKEMGYDAWSLTKEQAQRLSSASAEKLNTFKPHAEFEPDFWVTEAFEGNEFWRRLETFGSGAELYDVVARYWCPENEEIMTVSVCPAGYGDVTLSAVLGFCEGISDAETIATLRRDNAVLRDSLHSTQARNRTLERVKVEHDQLKTVHEAMKARIHAELDEA